MPAIELYSTPALPIQWIAKDLDTEELWIIPADPIAPEAWEQRRPYRGNYTLERGFMERLVERFYQPRPELTEEELPHYLTVEEVSKRLRCNPETVRRLVRTGLLQAGRIGNRMRIRAEDVDAYVAFTTERRAAAG